MKVFQSQQERDCPYILGRSHKHFLQDCAVEVVVVVKSLVSLVSECKEKPSYLIMRHVKFIRILF